jgi:hypothetical protein
VRLASEIAKCITSASPDADVALFVPTVFIEAARDAVGGKLEIGAEVSTKKETDTQEVIEETSTIFLTCRCYSVLCPKSKVHSQVLCRLPC